MTKEIRFKPCKKCQARMKRVLMQRKEIADIPAKVKSRRMSEEEIRIFKSQVAKGEIKSM